MERIDEKLKKVLMTMSKKDLADMLINFIDKKCQNSKEVKKQIYNGLKRVGVFKVIK